MSCVSYRMLRPRENTRPSGVRFIGSCEPIKMGTLQSLTLSFPKHRKKNMFYEKSHSKLVIELHLECRIYFKLYVLTSVNVKYTKFMLSKHINKMSPGFEM